MIPYEMQQFHRVSIPSLVLPFFTCALLTRFILHTFSIIDRVRGIKVSLSFSHHRVRQTLPRLQEESFVTSVNIFLASGLIFIFGKVYKIQCTIYSGVPVECIVSFELLFS